MFELLSQGINVRTHEVVAFSSIDDFFSAFSLMLLSCSVLQHTSTNYPREGQAHVKFDDLQYVFLP